jgi:hypothetical protein
LFLSKGKLIKKYSRYNTIIQKQGGRYALKDKKARTWLYARGVCYEPKSEDDLMLVCQLCEDGLMVEADKPNARGLYGVLTSHCICVNTQRSGLFPLCGLERQIMQWLQGNGRRLRMEELVYLIENDINPKEYKTDEFGVALSERIYRTRIQVDNTLRRDMSYAKCRDEVMNAVLRLFEKNRLYLA